MHNFLNVFRFGWPYFRKYRVRLALGLLFGMLFGVANGSFVWATNTLFSRLQPAPAENVQSAGTNTTSTVGSPLVPKAPSFLKEKTKAFRESADRLVDPWLPYQGRPLDWMQVLGGILFLPILVSVRGVVGYVSSYCMSWVSERVVNDLRVNVLNKLNTLSLDFFNRSTMGDLITRVNGDTATLHRCMILGFSDLVKEPFTVIGILIMLLGVSFKLTVVAFVFLPLCIIPIQILGKKTRKASKGNVNANVQQASLLVEMLSGIRIVKAFGLEQKQTQRFRTLSNELVHHGMKWVQARELVNPIIEAISALGLGVLILYIFISRTSLPDLMSFLMGIVICFSPLKKLASLHVMFQQASVGADRLMQIMKEEPTVKDPVNPKPVTGFTRAIEFADVSFAYREKPVLQNVSLAIPRGFKLGLAGESGSGKSTLTNLVFRFYDPTHGSIRIDGVDLRDVSMAQLHQQMALVSQDIVLFDLSVAENIALGKPGATQEEIEAAAKAAYAHDFITQLPQGYQTRIGERGVTLSGGQRQRLCIARAFVRNEPILVLDEATASLDSQAEAEVQAAIDRLSENRTVISVAHRLSTLANMDRIIVLSQGRIVEQGTFIELLELNGVFADMAMRQGIRAESYRQRAAQSAVK